MAKVFNGTTWVDAEQIAIDKKTDISFLPVANGTHFNGNGGAASTSLIQTRCRQTRKLLRIIAGGADQLQVEWANIWTSNTPQSNDATCEIAGPNAVSLRMAIEYPAGNPRIISGSSTYAAGTAYAVNDQIVYSGSKYVCIQAGTGQTPSSSPLYWRLVRTYVVRWTGDTDSSGTIAFAAGDYKKSLPIALQEKTKAGDKIAILGAFDSGNSSNYIPYAGANGASNTAPFVDWVVDAAGGLPAVGSSIVETGITNQTNGNTTTANSTTASAWMHIPYATAITGNIPSKRCVALIGDSLIQGTGGDIRDGEPAGIFIRALEGVSWWRVAQGGNRAGCYVGANAVWQMSVISRCSAVITDMAMNDIQANLTTAQVKTAMQGLWSMLATTGVPVYIGPPTPIAASSDSWATLVNQTRWTNAGAANTTQFPTDDASYLTSVYGQIAMWLTQDAATMSVDGVTVKAGELNHPVEGILDWRALIADPATSWKWNISYTADGAHPVGVAAKVAADYLRPQLGGVLQANQQNYDAFPSYMPSGRAPMQTFERTLASSQNTATSGTLLTALDVSPGRYYYGFRAWSGSATAGNRPWTLLVGSDPAKMKVIDSGTVSSGSVPVNGILGTTGVPFNVAPLWIPAGQLVALAFPVTAINQYAGIAANQANLHKAGLGFVLAGNSTDTAVLTGTVNLTSVTAGAAAFAANAFRIWAEVY